MKQIKPKTENGRARHCPFSSCAASARNDEQIQVILTSFGNCQGGVSIWANLQRLRPWIRSVLNGYYVFVVFFGVLLMFPLPLSCRPLLLLCRAHADLVRVQTTSSGETAKRPAHGRPTSLVSAQHAASVKTVSARDLCLRANHGLTLSRASGRENSAKYKSRR